MRHFHPLSLKLRRSGMGVAQGGPTRLKSLPAALMELGSAGWGFRFYKHAAPAGATDRLYRWRKNQRPQSAQGAGAAAWVIAREGKVSKITISSTGIGHTSAPQVSIAPPDVPAPSYLAVEMVAKVTIEGAIGSTNRIEATEAFGNTNIWTGVAAVVLTNGSQVFIDTISIPNRQRFYRVVVQGGTRPTTLPGFV